MILFKRIKTQFLLNSIGLHNGIVFLSFINFKPSRLFLAQSCSFSSSFYLLIIMILFFISYYLFTFARDNPYTHEVAGDLLPVGEEEHYLLAKRLRERFGSIFQRPYTPKAFEMHTTEIPRFIMNNFVRSSNTSLFHFATFHYL